MRIFIAHYSAEGRQPYQGLDLDIIAVTSSESTARDAIQTHAEERELRGEWYLEQWDLDGKFHSQVQVYPE